ncbi:DUF551 domain-containing protein [Citrobacter sp. RHBSTW-01013]|uniref:DUF551 domain-containing protein n=1 Tax=Citrobacter sp. RHBSTW-01013 TaxID=2742677 RepID=UPI0020178975|nr:DUF551 domain-containing protein [Citrobacter sp. RHBSTW-01013]
MTTNHPAHGPVSLERLHQIREILSKASAQSDGGNLCCAMADAVKVIDVAIAAMNADPVAWRYRYVHTPKTEEHGSPFTTEWKLCDSEDECNPSDCFERQPLYTAPQLPQPAVLSVPDEIPKLKDGMGFKHVKDGVRYSLNYANGWNQCRAAMLQAEPASNSDELPPDYLQGHKDGLEWAAQLAEANHPQTGDWLYDDQIELARAIRKGPDMPTVQDGKSPVTPDCWCRICRPVTMSDMRFVVCQECGNKRCPHANDHNNACTGSNEPGQVGSAYPAAPQQDVKSALEHGMQRYAGAMQKLSEGDR